MLTVGLTGGIGSGKSAVAQAFAALGIEQVDADALAHRLSQPGEPGYEGIVRAFGPAFVEPGGTLDRRALREHVFSDAQARSRLEAILHPMIAREVERSLASWQGRYGIVVVPLLLERSSLRGLIDRVLVVDCPEDEQVRRVGLRNGLGPAEVRAIMATQLPRAERLAAADDVIDNSAGPELLPAQVRALDRRYRALASAAGASAGATLHR